MFPASHRTLRKISQICIAVQAAVSRGREKRILIPLFGEARAWCNARSADLMGKRSMASVRSTIITQMEQIAREQNKKLAPLTDNVLLLETGLDSLAFAILVARLEEVLGYDPFTASSEVYYPTTLGEFVAFYETSKV
jgi:acyl carrier protein